MKGMHGVKSLRGVMPYAMQKLQPEVMLMDEIDSIPSARKSDGAPLLECQASVGSELGGLHGVQSLGAGIPMAMQGCSLDSRSQPPTGNSQSAHIIDSSRSQMTGAWCGRGA